jgi:hypothetical protein
VYVWKDTQGADNTGCFQVVAGQGWKRDNFFFINFCSPWILNMRIFYKILVKLTKQNKISKKEYGQFSK